MIKLDNDKRERFGRFCAGAIVLFVLAFMAYLLPSSLFRTTAVSTGSGKGEIVIFNYDNIFLNLITLAVTVGIFYLIYKYADRLSVKACYIALSVWVLVFGLGFVACAKLQPSEDSYILTFFARQCAHGDYSYYHDYFKLFPFQLGFVLYEELFFRLFFTLLPGAPAGFSSMALQGLNVIFVLMAYHCILSTVGLLTDGVAVRRLTAMLLFVCMPPLFTCTYMYGNLPALAFGSAACMKFVAFHKNQNWTDGLACVFFLALSVVLKLNSLIFFVALAILWLLQLVRRPGFRSAVLLGLLVAAVLAVQGLPQRYYEERCQVDFGSGVPKWGWLAMGLNEGQSCSGWYDTEFTTELFVDSGMDGAAASKLAKVAIADRLREFVAEPLEALRFFGRKFLSQWNEPSYQSLWTNQVRSHYSDPVFIYDILCHDLERAEFTLMKLYQQLIFFGFTVGLLRTLKSRELCMSLYPLIILGGMLYHLLFEAKSQFVLGYFVLMVPVAAYGFEWLFAKLKAYVPIFGNSRS